jgi:hypothetical protein
MKNSLYLNIRNKAAKNRRTGATPKKPTAEMLRQEAKIKAKKANGGPVGDDGLYNMQRALELGYTPDETGHWPSVDFETGMFLKSKEHPTAWMEYLYGHALNPELNRTTNVVVNPEGYFGENQLQYIPKAQGGYVDGDKDKNKKPKTRIYTDPEEFKIAQKNYSDSLDVYNLSLKVAKNKLNLPEIDENTFKSLNEKNNTIDPNKWDFDKVQYEEDNKRNKVKNFKDYMYETPDLKSGTEEEYKNHYIKLRENSPQYARNYPIEYDTPDKIVKLKNGIERHYPTYKGEVLDETWYTDIYSDGTSREYSDGQLFDINTPNIQPIDYKYYGEDKPREYNRYDLTSSSSGWYSSDEKPKFKNTSNESYVDYYIPTWLDKIYKKPEVKPILKKSTSQTRPTLSQLDKLQPKQYTSSNQQPGLVGNVENISPSEINMNNFFEGTYEKYKRGPHYPTEYRVWLPNQKMDIVSEDKFKELNENYYLQNLEEKSKGGLFVGYAEGGYYAEGGGDDDKNKIQKAAASTTSVNTRALPEGLFEHIKANPPARQPEVINVVDKRKQNPITKKPINPNRDLVGGQFEDTIPIDIIKSSYKHQVDPGTSLAVGLLESRMGTTDSNVGHIMVDPYSDYIPGAEDMVMTIKEKQDYAKRLGYTDPLLQLQAYNGLGVLSNKRGEIGKSAYGIPIPKEGIDLRKNPLYAKKVQNIRDSVIMQSPDLVRLMDYYKPKMDGGHMYYSGGPMQYEVGGKVWKNIAAGLYGAGEGILDTITMGATDQLTDRGFDYLTKVGNKNIDLNNPDDVKFLKTQQQVKGYSNTAGAIGTAVVTGNVQGAITQGTKGLNTAFQASDWASDDFKKWSQGVSGVAGLAAGFAGGLNSDSFNAAAKAGTGVAGFGQKAGKIGSFGNQAMGMIGGNQQPLWQQGEARQDYLNSPEYLAMRNGQNQQYVNQGLSFSNGGNVNNNSLNLQNSMRNRYNSYRKKSKGGTFHQYGINQIPDSAGLHHQNAYGGVPIGPDAMAEGGEYVLDDNYVVSDQVDGMNTQTDEFGNTMAENLKTRLNKYTLRDLDSKNKGDLRRPNDSIAQNTIDQIKQQAMMETEMARAEAQAQEEQNMAMREAAVQYAAAGGKLNKDITKIVEEEYAAAYGGQINPKKYKGLNMPYSGGGKLPKEVLRARAESHMSPQEADAYVKQYGEGGGIHIKESKKGTFTAAATKHGKSVQEFAKQVLANKDNYSSKMVQKANFARNAAGWKHADGGYVYKPMVQPMLADGGPIYGDPASEYVYAGGGPMVSNVPQPFNGPSAQNRGGMMIEYGRGGNMYAVGGPPDGDPNSLDYITGVSDFMYSPEFLNYWTNSQDNKNMNYLNLYERGNQPLSEERFKPTEGISDFDRTLGNLKQSFQEVILEESPDGSLCYIDENGKKVCGPAGQVMAMAANKGLQPKIVQRTYQNTTGDMAPYNYGNLPGISSTTASPVNQPDYSGDQNFTNRQQQIRNMVPGAVTKTQPTSQPINEPTNTPKFRNFTNLSDEGVDNAMLANIPVQSMPSKPYTFPTNNKMPGIIGKEEPMPGFSDYTNQPIIQEDIEQIYTPSYTKSNTVGFIPNDVMVGKMGTSTAPSTDGVGPVNTSMPRDISTEQTARFTPPLGSDMIEDLPGYTPNPIQVSNEAIGLNQPNSPKLTFTQSDATKYGLNPNDVNIIEDPKVKSPNQPNQGLTGLDYASMGIQALGPLSQLYYGLKGPDDVNYERIKADKIDPYRAITLANEESRRAQDLAGYNLRQNAPTSGSYMANMRALGLGAGKQRGAQTAATQYQADVANTQMQNQVNAQNAQISMQEQIDRLQERDAARTNVTEGLSGLGSSTANMIRDYRTNQVNQTIANNIGTNNFKLNTVNKTITYRGDDGKTYTIPLESVIPSNTGTTEVQQPSSFQTQTNFDKSLNQGFRNRFTGPNAGK